MTLRHSSLSPAVSSSTPSTRKSSAIHLLQLFLGLLPSTSMARTPPIKLLSPALLTWPNHLSRFLLSTLSISSSPQLSKTTTLGILSCHLTPATYLNILLSVPLTMFFILSVSGHVSEPYSMHEKIKTRLNARKVLSKLQQLLCKCSFRPPYIVNRIIFIVRVTT